MEEYFCVSTVSSVQPGYVDTALEICRECALALRKEGSTDSLVGRVFIFGAGERLPRMRAQRRQRAILYSWDTLMVTVNVGNALEMKGLNEYHGHAGYI